MGEGECEVAHPQAIEKHNAAVRGYNHDDETRQEILVQLQDSGGLFRAEGRSEFELNLDDWVRVSCIRRCCGSYRKQENISSCRGACAKHLTHDRRSAASVLTIFRAGDTPASIWFLLTV